MTPVTHIFDGVRVLSSTFGVISTALAIQYGSVLAREYGACRRGDHTTSTAEEVHARLGLTVSLVLFQVATVLLALTRLGHAPVSEWAWPISLVQVAATVTAFAVLWALGRAPKVACDPLPAMSLSGRAWQAYVVVVVTATVVLEAFHVLL